MKEGKGVLNVGSKRIASNAGRRGILFGSGEHSAVLNDGEVLDQNLFAISGKFHSSPPNAGILARKEVGERIAIPMREFVVGATRREPQNELIPFRADLHRAVVRIEVLACICSEWFCRSWVLGRFHVGVVR